jgi:class 3 adenylate cyclase/tetratricopeptide (TPR) repeat protein
LSTVLPYLPRLAAEWELETPGTRWRELEATCCFVDISGFTALSERLARRGRVGAEELTEVLNHVFSRMLAVAYEKGGSLLKFGGDALFLKFTGDDHPVLAAQAAVAMRAGLREAQTLPTSVGRVQLRMSVGLHSGTFHFFRVGHSHRELLVAGPAATMTTWMEQTASAGEIVVSPATAARLPHGAVGKPKDDGHLLRWRAIVEGGPSASPQAVIEDADVQRGIPVALRQHLLEGARESEHRNASVGFVKFLGVDDLLADAGPDATADALEHIVTTVQEAVDAEGVTLLASDVDANGGKLILVAGVPVAREDDDGRLLRASRAILDHDFTLPVKIGVNRGHVFTGDIGAEFRRTFTVMGDTVNLAARLMAAASPGALYATAEVLDRAATTFEVETLEPFHVKGKAQPVQAYSVGVQKGPREVETSSLPFVGRNAQLSRLRDAVQAAAGGRGSLVAIEGDRGAGKTRLLRELLDDVSGTVVAFQAEAFASEMVYFPLRTPLRALFGIDAAGPERGAAELARAFASRAPDLKPLAPLLNPVLAVDLAPTHQSDAIAIEFRRDRLADLLVALLDTVSGPVVFVVDDAQWLDVASTSLLERVFAGVRARPWLAIVTTRPAMSGFQPAAPDLSIALEPLDVATANGLVDAVTSAAPLRPHERDQLVQRAAGNPLFLEELLRVARTSDLSELPETLDAVAIREIDTLPAAARHVVRYASVLGRTFDIDLLCALLDTPALDERDVLTPLESYLTTSGDGQMQFRHAVLLEAAYESLPFRTRIDLHRRAGDAILSRRGVDRGSDAAFLSLHFFRAQRWRQAFEFGREAGQRAADASAPTEAALHFERAVVAARRLGDVPATDVADLFMQLGEALVTLGVYEQADEAYRRAAAALPDQPVRRAAIAERRSFVRGEHQGRLAAAIRQVRAGLALLDAAPGSGDEAARVRVHLRAREADLRARQGRLAEAARICGEVMVDAERLGEQRALAIAITVLDTCLVEMGRPHEATHMGRALDLYEQLGDHLYVAITLGNMGGISFVASNWIDAANYFVRAAEAAETAGDVAAAAIAQANLGELRVNQGRLEEAELLLTSAVRTLEACEYVVAAAWAMLHLGRARTFLGQHEEGVLILERAATTLDSAGALVGLIEARARLAEVHTFAGDVCAAEVQLAHARELERKLGETSMASFLDRIEIALALRRGDDAHVDEAISRAREAGAKYDLLVLLTLADTVTGEGHLHADRVELATILDVLGVPGLPEVHRRK